MSTLWTLWETETGCNKNGSRAVPFYTGCAVFSIRECQGKKKKKKKKKKKQNKPPN
jgi:hypothetical protein